jgi:ligand-binding sensor domain-containing protein/two-component sensor histidine kinase
MARASLEPRSIARVLRRSGGLALLWLALSWAAQAVEPERRLERLGLDDGLSQASVWAVLRDRRGLVWIGTQDGLNRYDGYSVRVYHRDSHDPDSLSDNFVTALQEGPDGELWIGTWAGGLNRYDPATGRFRRYQQQPGDPHALSDNRVRALLVDRDGVVWVGTASGLNRLERSSGRFTRYRHQADDSGSLGSDLIRALHQDRAGRVWVGTEGGGLNLLDPERGRFLRYRPEAPAAASASPGQASVWALTDGPDGQLWVGTDGGGVLRFTPESGRFERADLPELQATRINALSFDPQGRLWIGTNGHGLGEYTPARQRLRWHRHAPSDPLSLGHDHVLALHPDGAGQLWIGTLDGLARFAARTQQFAHFLHREDEPHSLSHDWVRSFLVDARGTLWVATLGGGVNRWDAEGARFIHYRHRPGDDTSLSDDEVWSLAAGADGAIWVGGRGGLDRFDPEREQFAPMPLRDAAAASRSADVVRTIHVDADGSLWLGTWGSGLIHLDPRSGATTRYVNDPDDPHSLAHDDVPAIARDGRGRLWLGTWGGGLNLFDPVQQRFVRYRHDPNDPQGLSNDTVRAILEDRDGMLWLATQGGLNRFDPQTGTVRAYSVEDGLADDSIYGILEDGDGHLWLSSNGGLSRFDPKRQQFTNYTARDGLQSDEFNSGAYFRSASGELFFGGIRGFNRFHPERIETDRTPPPVLLTELLLFNKPVPLQGRGDGFSLPQPIDSLPTLTLSHRESLIAFEFAALDFSDPRHNRFAYRLEGFDADWIETDYRNRRATYTHLPAGNYRFRVKAANPFGVWNEEGASLAVTVLPPWYRSGWAWFGYVLAVLLALVFGYRWRTARIRNHARRLERLVEQRTLELSRAKGQAEDTLAVLQGAQAQLVEAERMASLGQLVAGVAHELNTPLGIAMTAASHQRDIGRELAAKAEAQTLGAGELTRWRTTVDEACRLVLSSLERMRGLIDSFKQVAVDQTSERARRFDLRTYLEEVHDTLRPILKRCPHRLAIECPPGIELDTYPGALFHILTNLVNNSLIHGFAPGSRGNMRIEARDLGSNVELRYSDDGVGMPASVAEQAFEPFFTTRRGNGSSGLGLSIVYNLVTRKLGGRIRLETRPGAGTAFVLEFPRQWAGREPSPREPQAELGTATERP